MVLHLFSVCILLLLSACVTSSGGGEQDQKKQSSGSGSFRDHDERLLIDKSSLLHSLGRHPLLPGMIDQEKAATVAEDIAARTKGSQAETSSQYEDLIAAERLAGAAPLRLLSHLHKLAELNSGGGSGKVLSEKARLEVALGAMQDGQYSLADFFLQDLQKAADERVRAGAYNALGVIALKENRLPEAVAYWEQSLRELETYEAALLNLGFISLKYAHFDAAIRYLSRIPSGDWFVNSGLMVAERLTAKSKGMPELCRELPEPAGNHKTTVFNCGVYAWQSDHNPALARDLIRKAISMEGGEPGWDQKGYKILEKLQ